MPVTSHFVDGSKNLADQETALNFMEQFTASQVISYAESAQSSAGAKNNEAILQPVPFGRQPPPLQLIALPAGGDVTSAVFHETCWVESKETLVIGVRKGK